MKKLFFIATLILLGTESNSQTLFEFDNNGDIIPNPNVIEIDKSSEDIYEKAVDWINFNYKNPEFVMKGRSEDNFLRFSGIKKNLSTYKSMGVTMDYDLHYTIRIDFKDNKYRLTIENAYLNDENYILNNKKIMDFAKGKKMKIAMTEYSTNSISYINSINESLHDYISGKSEQEDSW